MSEDFLIDDYIPKEQENIDLSLYEGEDRVISSIELYEKLKTRKGNIIWYKSNISTLDKLIFGFCGGNLVVVSGKTGQGKTLWCQTLTKTFSLIKENSLWFTYEIPMLQFLEQFGKDIPHFYMPSILKNANMKWIYERIVEAKLKFGIKFVFIDHLHYLADIMIKNNPSLEIGKVMRTLKLWAKDLDLVIFIVCHMSKVKSDKEPEEGDTRDSSFVEQEADKVFYIWRMIDIENGAFLKVTKDRETGAFNKRIKLIKQGNYLMELTDKKIPSIEEICDIEEDNFGEDL